MTNLNKDQLSQHFPGITDQDVQNAKSNPDQFAREYAQRTGQDENQVRQTLQTAQNQGGSGSQGQGRNA